MSALLTGALVLAWGLGLVLVALVVLPWELVVDARLRDVEPSGALHLRWGWRLVSVEARPAGGLVVRVSGLVVYRRGWRSGSEKPKKDKKPRRAKKGKKPSRSKRGLRWAMRHRRALAQMAGEVVAACHPSGRISGRLGLGDPAATAWLMGLGNVVAGRCRRCDLDLQWDWLEEVVDLELRAGGWLVPVHLAAIALGWLLRRSTRRALFA